MPITCYQMVKHLMKEIKMDLIKKLVLKLKEVFIFNQQKEDEQYLAKSVDIYDLEHRMRQLDKRNKNYF